MLLIPNSNATAEMSDSFGFKMISHPIKKNKTSKSKNGKPRLKNEMNHHFCGFNEGAMLASKKKNTTTILQIIKNRLVNRRSLLGIDAN